MCDMNNRISWMLRSFAIDATRSLSVGASKLYNGSKASSDWLLRRKMPLTRELKRDRRELVDDDDEDEAPEKLICRTGLGAIVYNIGFLDVSFDAYFVYW